MSSPTKSKKKTQINVPFFYFKDYLYNLSIFFLEMMKYATTPARTTTETTIKTVPITWSLLIVLVFSD